MTTHRFIVLGSFLEGSRAASQSLVQHPSQGKAVLDEALRVQERGDGHG